MISLILSFLLVVSLLHFLLKKLSGERIAEVFNRCVNVYDLVVPKQGVKAFKKDRNIIWGKGKGREGNESAKTCGRGRK